MGRGLTSPFSFAAPPLGDPARFCAICTTSYLFAAKTLCNLTKKKS